VCNTALEVREDPGVLGDVGENPYLRYLINRLPHCGLSPDVSWRGLSGKRRGISLKRENEYEI
jgi:hypothetical protein